MLKIWIGSVELCRGPVRGSSTGAGPSDLRISGERIIQERQFLRAVQCTMQNRGNVKTVVTFTVTREHSSIQNAWTFALLHYATLPGQGTITFEAATNTGAVKRIYLDNAALSVSEHQANGVRTRHTYTIQGGAMR